jgi:large subunit ribosomal protein L25
MTETISLDAQVRDVVGKQVKRLRQQGLLPATAYGKDFGPLSLQINEKTFSAIYRDAGKTTLLNLKIAGQKPQKALIYDVQRHPVKRDIIHADFRVVDLKVEMDAEVPILLVGESPLVERDDAVLNSGITSVVVHALPEDIPHHIEVDISQLDSLDKVIYVSDLASQAGFTFQTPADTLVVTLTQTRAAEAEEEEEQEEISMDEPALIRKEREEDEEA